MILGLFSLCIFDTLYVIHTLIHKAPMNYRSKEEEEEGELPYFKIMKWALVVLSLLALLILVDFFLPANCSELKVHKKLAEKEDTRFGNTDYTLKVFTDKLEFKANPALFEALEEGHSISLCRSPLFQSIRTVKCTHRLTKEPFETELIAPVYKGYGSFPLAVIVLSLVAFFYKSDDTVAYGSGILALIVAVSLILIF